MARDVKPQSLANLDKTGREEWKWKPGQSGNPGGRPSYAKALEVNGTTTPDLLAKLVGKALTWLDDDADQKRSEYAHMWLTERILRIGKPKEEMDLNVAGASPEQMALIDALRMTPHERRKAIEAQDTTATSDAADG